MQNLCGDPWFVENVQRTLASAVSITQGIADSGKMKGMLLNRVSQNQFRLYW